MFYLRVDKIWQESDLEHTFFFGPRYVVFPALFRLERDMSHVPFLRGARAGITGILRAFKRLPDQARTLV